jgi:hypothetical protein
MSPLRLNTSHSDVKLNVCVYITQDICLKLVLYQEGTNCVSGR